MIDRRQRHREPEVGERAHQLGEAHAADAETDRGRAPGDQHAGRDGDEARWDAARIAHAAEPGRQDDGERDEADGRRHVDLHRRAHGDEGDRHACERAQQRGARRDLADEGRDEAADHQDEALEEHPDQPRLPGLDGVVGLGQDRQHDHERDDEHVRHAHARRAARTRRCGPCAWQGDRRAMRSRRWRGTSSGRARGGCGRTPGCRGASARSASRPVSTSMLTRMLVPKPKKAFQSPGTQSAGPFADCVAIAEPRSFLVSPI